MELREYGAADGDVVEQVVALGNAIRDADWPWGHDETRTTLSHRLEHGWDGEPPRSFAGLASGRVVVSGEIWTSQWDNLHFADLGVGVRPDARRHGYGSLLLERLMAESRAAGRTSLGMGGWDSPTTHAFAAAHGFQPKIRNVNRRQVLAEADWATIERVYADAARHAADYELLRLPGRTPEPLLPAMAELTAAINDAPLDDMDIEDEVFTAERVASYEASQAALGRVYRVVARNRDSGALAGHTVVVVEAERPWIGDQHDTSVVRTHRGHRLGLLLKADMLRWLREAEPGLATIDTWNAKSNRHMIAVNEALGYRVMGESVFFQRAF